MMMCDIKFFFIFHSPKINWLGQLATTEVYAESDVYHGLDNLPGIKIVRFGSPLFYLNVETFKDNILAAFASEMIIKRQVNWPMIIRS